MPPEAARSWIEVSATALRANLRSVQAFVAPLAVFPVLKADAYGHGLPLVAEALKGERVPFFAVDSVEEAAGLADLLPGAPLLILGHVPLACLEETVARGWSFVCSKVEVAQALACLPPTLPPARIHLEVETGLHRQGADAATLNRILSIIHTAPARFRVEGVCSHFANVEDASARNAYPSLQEARFFAACARVEAAGHAPVWRHLGCSAAGWVRSGEGFTALRLGISLYGLWSSPEIRVQMQAAHPDVVLQPALTWNTRIAERKAVPAGEPVGYGLSERMAKDAELAVLPVGYYDGLDRRLSGCGEVLIRGRRCRVVGRVCMNMCMVDVSDVPEAVLEEEVVLFGAQGIERITPEDWERLVPGLIAYEAIARLRAGIPRALVGADGS